MKIANSKKKEAAAKKDAGGDEKLLFFFTWPYKCINIWIWIPQGFGLPCGTFLAITCRKCVLLLY